MCPLYIIDLIAFGPSEECRQFILRAQYLSISMYVCTIIIIIIFLLEVLLLFMFCLLWYHLPFPLAAKLYGAPAYRVCLSLRYSVISTYLAAKAESFVDHFQRSLLLLIPFALFVVFSFRCYNTTNVDVALPYRYVKVRREAKKKTGPVWPLIISGVCVAADTGGGDSETAVVSNEGEVDEITAKLEVTKRIS